MINRGIVPVKRELNNPIAGQGDFVVYLVAKPPNKPQILPFFTYLELMLNNNRTPCFIAGCPVVIKE